MEKIDSKQYSEMDLIKKQNDIRIDFSSKGMKQKNKYTDCFVWKKINKHKTGKKKTLLYS